MRYIYLVYITLHSEILASRKFGAFDCVKLIIYFMKLATQSSENDNFSCR